MIFFTADLHLGHANIIEYSGRPFADVDEMNRALIDNWNAVVSDRDTVYVLGDLALGKINETLPLARELRGRKLLVPGNHDRCWTGHKKVQIQMYEDQGIEVMPSCVRLGRYLLCHFPYTVDERHGDRYGAHRPLNLGRHLLHGHVHEAWKVSGRQTNVGVDVWDYRPVSMEEIECLG